MIGFKNQRLNTINQIQSNTMVIFNWFIKYNFPQANLVQVLALGLKPPVSDLALNLVRTILFLSLCSQRICNDLMFQMVHPQQFVVLLMRHKPYLLYYSPCDLHSSASISRLTTMRRVLLIYTIRQFSWLIAGSSKRLRQLHTQKE